MKLQLFPEKSPLSSVCIEVVGELIRTQRRNQYILVVTERFSKTIKTLANKGIWAEEVADNFINAWVFNYGRL